MPIPVKIRVRVIAHSMPYYEGMDQWLRDVAPAYNTDRLIGCPDQERVIAVAAKRCYMSFVPGGNVTKVRSNWLEYFDRILSAGHGSVLEHSTVSFAIEGVTRVFTGEMNRHRAGVAISEGSMRYIRYDNMKYWIPTSLQHCETDDAVTEAKKFKSREVLDMAFSRAEEAYQDLRDIWDVDSQDFATKKKLTSMFRRVCPMGVSTGGVWTFNLRALRHVIALRGTEHAEEEIFLVATKMAELTSGLLSFRDFEGCKPQYPKV